MPRYKKIWVWRSWQRATLGWQRPQVQVLSLRPKIRKSYTNSYGFFFLFLCKSNIISTLCALCYFVGTYKVHTFEVCTRYVSNNFLNIENPYRARIFSYSLYLCVVEVFLFSTFFQVLQQIAAIAAYHSRFDSGNIMFFIAYYFLGFLPRF